DEDIQAPEPVDGGGYEVANRAVQIQIAGEAQDLRAGPLADLRSRALQVVPRAAAHGHLDAFPRQHLGAGPPQALARATDDRHLVFQFEIHRPRPSRRLSLVARLAVRVVPAIV